MQTSSLSNALQTTLDLDIDGWILTNTTLSRPPGLKFPVEGGVSGAPLKDLSRSCLKNALSFLSDKKGDRLLISAGGVDSSSEVQMRLDAGADLVQIYSALIFEGPLLFRNILNFLQTQKS
jgi:dihydroorotate dehydrogenase